MPYTDIIVSSHICIIKNYCALHYANSFNDQCLINRLCNRLIKNQSITALYYYNRLLRYIIIIDYCVILL